MRIGGSGVSGYQGPILLKEWKGLEDDDDRWCPLSNQEVNECVEEESIEELKISLKISTSI